MNRLKSIVLHTIVIVITIMVLSEIVLRLVFGLGNPPLYVASEHYEYILAPNQDLTRFGNRIIVNEYSMRSRPIDSTAQYRILFVGDSVVHGGNLTDHDELASTIVERKLSEQTNKVVQTLNVSAGSWGPDNAAAYLKRHGLFDVDLIVAVWSSHDAGDMMTFRPQVGVDPAMPDERPLFALSEAFMRYGPAPIRAFARDRRDPDVITLRPDWPEPDYSKINPGWDVIIDLADSVDVPLLVYLHAEIDEVKTGHYNSNGERIIDLLDGRHIPIIQALNVYDVDSDYRDYIHLNARGQAAMARAILNWIGSCPIHEVGYRVLCSS